MCKSNQREVAKRIHASSLSFPFQIVNGYFVHFFAPQGLPVVPKNIVFVIDVSGSMQGRKMEQVLSSVQVGVTDGRGREIFFLSGQS